jgi:hypothetical protein
VEPGKGVGTVGAQRQDSKHVPAIAPLTSADTCCCHLLLLYTGGGVVLLDLD